MTGRLKVVFDTMKQVFPSIGDNSSANHDPQWEPDGNGLLWAILAAGPTVPTFLRVLDEGSGLFFVHVDHI
jgi:hypothetical protein